LRSCSTCLLFNLFTNWLRWSSPKWPMKYRAGCKGREREGKREGKTEDGKGLAPFKPNPWIRLCFPWRSFFCIHRAMAFTARFVLISYLLYSALHACRKQNYFLHRLIYHECNLHRLLRYKCSIRVVYIQLTTMSAISALRIDGWSARHVVLVSTVRVPYATKFFSTTFQFFIFSLKTFFCRWFIVFCAFFLAFCCFCCLFSVSIARSIHIYCINEFTFNAENFFACRKNATPTCVTMTRSSAATT